MNESAHSGEYTMWSGLDVGTDNRKALAQIERFYAQDYEPEMEKLHPSLADQQRYELLATDRHGGFGAKFMTAATWKSERAIPKATGQSGSASFPTGPAAWRDAVTISWSLLYRHVAETGPLSARPYAIYFVGVNPPPAMNDTERTAFLEFYTGTHVSEVAARRNCTRATIYELRRELQRPAEGTPQFLGVYEVAEEKAVVTRHVGFGYSRGPSVWQKHKTPWRLWYRRLPD